MTEKKEKIKFMKYITVEQMNEACDNEYNENYSHGGYCHEQSFRFGFQEGVEYAEKQILNKVQKYLENELFTSFDIFGNVETKTKDFVDKNSFINNLIKAM